MPRETDASLGKFERLPWTEAAQHRRREGGAGLRPEPNARAIAIQRVAPGERETLTRARVAQECVDALEPAARRVLAETRAHDQARQRAPPQRRFERRQRRDFEPQAALPGLEPAVEERVERRPRGILRLARQLRQLRQARDRTGRDRLEDGHDFRAQPIARDGAVGVARIGHEREPAPREILGELGAAQAEQGAQHAASVEARPNCGEPRRSGPAQRAQQHRLGLVVALMRGEETRVATRDAHALERRVAERARARLRRAAVAARGVDALDVERDTELCGQLRHELELALRLRPAQTVVDVRDSDALPERQKCVQERHGVRATGHCGQQARRAPDAVCAQKARELAMHWIERGRHPGRVRARRSRRRSQHGVAARRKRRWRGDPRVRAWVELRRERCVLDSLFSLASGLVALAQSLSNDQPLATGALVGLGGGLMLAWLVRRRHHREAQPIGGEKDVQKLVARGELEQAADLLAERQQFARAAPLYEKAGAKAKLARALLQAKQPARAARVYTEMGRHAEAAHYFEASGAWREAGEALLSLGDERAAAELLERGGELERAARIHVRLGDPESAAWLFGRAGLGVEAAEALLEARGRKPRILHRAAELYESAGDFERAAGAFAEAAEPRRAAELFERIHRFSKAAECYTRSGAFERAADCHEKADEITLARAAWERAGDRVRAAELALEEGKNLEAGSAFYEVGSYERAIDTLQRIPATSPDARGSWRLLARIFLEKGLIDRARERLQALSVAGTPEKDDLELLLTLSNALERLGDGAGALEALEKIAGVDADYADVAARLERLRERPAGPATVPTAAESSRYELRDEIGRGGMGIVRLAWDRELERPVAIKFLPHELAANPEALRMFRAEARAAASMNHPNIVHIYDVAVLEGEPCIVMEYLQGRTVREVMRVRGSNEKQPLPPKRVAEIGREICHALAYAHRQNVIHRDVKPSNMLLAADGTVKLMDFGISKVMETGDEARSEAKGTPQYMPPEQILGREIDGRTDLYALGISMFEIATAQRPFSGESVVDQQLHAVLPDPRRIRPEIPEALVHILQRACEKNPDQRYASAHEMAQALERFLDESEESGES